MAILPVGISGEAGAYQIERSLRFNSADSAYLNRTPGSAGNRKTWTISVWIKRTNPGTENWVYDGGSTSNSSGFQFTDTNLLRVLSTSSSGAVDDLDIRTTQVFRDPSAWYHIVLAVDTTQATSTNRVKLYVNGSQVTAFGTANYPSLNYDFGVNNNHSQKIGKWNISTGRDFNGYMADFYLVDGSALTPSSFGETDTDTGVWKPKAYTGSYGTNGFYLDFADNSSTTALGYDAAGSNDWTPNNFSVTAGAGNDSLVDSPTRYGTDTGVGGEVRGNYCTWNSLVIPSGYSTISNGNLTTSFTNTGNGAGSCGTFFVSSGKWYWELNVDVAGGATTLPEIGVASSAYNFYAAAGSYYLSSSPYGWVYRKDGSKANNGSSSAYGSSWTTGDLLGVALDMDAGTITFYKNGVSQGQAYSGITGLITPACDGYNVSGAMTFTANFGQIPFRYTAPSGFKALCTTNLPEPTIAEGADYFGTLLWTGDGTSGRTIATGQSGVTGTVEFTPDLVWIKERNNVRNHVLTDILRGGTAQLRSNTTGSETQFGNMNLTFTDGGFTNAGSSSNDSSNTFVAWNWKANGAGVSNTDGTITSTVSASTASGFSVVSYTGTGSNATVGHGLGVAPAMIIVKNRASTTDWAVYHKNLTSAAYWLELNSTGGQQGPNSVVFNSTAPTSTVFSVGTNDRTNTNNHVALCFAPVEGYSAFGSYTGNGSTDGPFVFTGFRPRFVMIKATSTTGNWEMLDSVRDTYNPEGSLLRSNSSGAEIAASPVIDFLSNGFKPRSINGNQNDSGVTYIYAAFAENPFRNALAR